MRFSPTCYRDYSSFLTLHFSCKVQKVAIDGGFTCPNRDGTKGTGGCIYCSNRAFSPAYCSPAMSVTAQIEAGKRFLAHKYPHMHYLAYFQAHTGTYAPLSRLKALYEEALNVDGVVGLVISTRPDCVDEPLLSYLQQLAQRTFVMLEFGIETAHDRTLAAINRCHTWAQSRRAINAAAHHRLPVCAHLILGLPGETKDDMVSTVRAISALPVAVVKFHQLQVIRGTRLEQEELTFPTAQEYARLCAHLVTWLRPDIAIERFVSESPVSLLVAPRWGLRPQVFNFMVEDLLNQSGTHQGSSL